MKMMQWSMSHKKLPLLQSYTKEEDRIEEEAYT
jgi:hypothetical protein